MTETTYTRDQVRKSLQDAIGPLRRSLDDLAIKLEHFEQTLFDGMDLRRWGIQDESNED